MSVAANRYARALMDVLYPEKAEAGQEQLQQFAKLLDDQPDARRLLENPTMSGDRRSKLLNEIGRVLGFEKRVSNFIGILVEKNRLELLDEILAAYRKLLGHRLGLVRATPTADPRLPAARPSTFPVHRRARYRHRRKPRSRSR